LSFAHSPGTSSCRNCTPKTYCAKRGPTTLDVDVNGVARTGSGVVEIEIEVVGDRRANHEEFLRSFHVASSASSATGEARCTASPPSVVSWAAPSQDVLSPVWALNLRPPSNLLWCNREKSSLAACPAIWQSETKASH
jgi:hypothetical protein